MPTKTFFGLRHQACLILQTFGRPKSTLSMACGMSSSRQIPTMTLLLLKWTCTVPTVVRRYSTGKTGLFPKENQLMRNRMFVLESSGSDIWTSTYSFKSELNTYDQFAIDGTYFQHSTGLYHIYSCWYRQYDGWPANLCITKSELQPYSNEGGIALTSHQWKTHGRYHQTSRNGKS